MHEVPSLLVAGDLAQALFDSSLPLEVSPDPGDPAWQPVTDLLEPQRWADLGQRYSRWIRTPHAAPGLVCALQHYAGRAMAVMVTTWCADGTLLDPDHDRWLARIDGDGATRAVAVPGLPSIGRSDDPDVLAEAVLGHLGPLVDATVAAGNATRRLALGCVAASTAGGFGLGWRSVPPDRRPAVAAAADQVLAQFTERGRPMVSMVGLSRPEGLAHDRHVCCLIRLGEGHDMCASCPDLPADERRRRQRDFQRTAMVVNLRGKTEGR